MKAFAATVASLPLPQAKECNSSLPPPLGEGWGGGSAIPTYRHFRAGDVRHSLADISKAQRLLGYEPTHRLADGVAVAMPWYVKQAGGVAPQNTQPRRI